MICREIIAEVLTPKEAAAQHFEKPKLFIDETDYKIVTWSNDVITAQYLAPVADFELRISLKLQEKSPKTYNIAIHAPPLGSATDKIHQTQVLIKV
jgi:hypothetical protein